MTNLSLFFILLYLSRFSNPKCIELSSLSGSSTPLSCAGSNIITSGSPGYPSSLASVAYSKFTIDFEVSDSSRCSIATGEHDLFAMSWKRSGVPDDLFARMYLKPAWNSVFLEGTLDFGAIWQIAQIGFSTTLKSNDVYGLLFSVDFTNSVINAWINAQGVAAYGLTPIFFNTATQLDNMIQFHICTDFATGAASALCKIHTFASWYTYEGDLTVYSAGLGKVTPFATYLFNEGHGNTILNYANSQYPAYLGSPSPQRFTTEAGIEFTSPNQYVTLPTFQIEGYSQYYSGALTLSFWLKYSANNQGYIFRQTNQQSTIDYFSLYIDNAGFLRPDMMGKTGSLSSTPVLSTTWTLITVSYLLRAGNDNAMVIYEDGNIISLQSIVPTIPIGFASTDFIRIGGPPAFRGSISNFQIFNHGSALVTQLETCSPFSHCTFGIGLIDYDQCLSFSSTFCHSSCLTCADSGSSSCFTCQTGLTFQNGLCKTPAQTPITSQEQEPVSDPALKRTITASVNTQTTMRAVTHAVNAISRGTSLSISAAVGSKIFTNIKFLNIAYPNNLEEALATWRSSFISLGLTPDMPDSIKNKIPHGSVPFVFSFRDVFSSFLVNFWESLGMLLLISIIFAIARVSEWLFKRHTFLFNTRAAIQNFLLAQCYSAFGDILMYGILQLRSPSFKSGWASFSFIACLILFVTMILLILFHSFLLRKYQALKQQHPSSLTEFTEKQKGNQILLNDYKDTSLLQQSFLLLVTGRELIFSLFLATMFKHPLAESILILILNSLLIAYLLLKSPFKEALDTAQQLFYETIVILVSISVLIMSGMDSVHSKGYDIRNFLGRLVIGLNFCFNFGGLGFMLFKGFLACREFYLRYKEKKSKVKSLKIHQAHRLNTSDNFIKLESSESHAKIHPAEQVSNEHLNTSQNLIEPHFINQTYQNSSHMEASRIPLDFSQTQHGDGNSSSLQINRENTSSRILFPPEVSGGESGLSKAQDYAVQLRMNSRKRIHALKLAHDKKLEPSS